MNFPFQKSPGMWDQSAHAMRRRDSLLQDRGFPPLASSAAHCCPSSHAGSTHCSSSAFQRFLPARALGAGFQKPSLCPAPPAQPRAHRGHPSKRPSWESLPSGVVLRAKLVYLVTGRYSGVWLCVLHRRIFCSFSMWMLVKLMNVLSSR